MPLKGNNRHRFAEADICDHEKVSGLFEEFRPQAVMHLAAESHVDRSITGPGAFIRTNVVGTQVMLEAARATTTRLRARSATPSASSTSRPTRSTARCPRAPFFTEDSRYDPRSPYSASKGGATTWPAPGTRPTACRCW